MYRPTELMAPRRQSVAAALHRTVRLLMNAPADDGTQASHESLTSRGRWRMAFAPRHAQQHDNRFQQEVRERLGVLPNFFQTLPGAQGLIEQIWQQALSAYLDNPLPALFKERLFVHLSRFCEVRYSVARHAGFLLGKGYPAGHASAAAHTVEQVIALLSRPVPNAARLEASLARLEAHAKPKDIPAPDSADEEDLFDALTIMFLIPGRSAQARLALRRAVGDAHFEHMATLLAFIRTEHYWTETHPDLAYETDLIKLMAQRQDLARVLLDTADSEWANAGDALRETLTGQLQVLNTELQHRTRNLLSVIEIIFERTRSKHITLDDFSEVFASRLNAISRVQTYLSRLMRGEKVTFDGLLRAELAAHAVAQRQITLDGPDGVRLRSSTLQTFALAIHELVVNAVKYGALSTPAAHLAVRWQVERAEGEAPMLHVQWQETGVETLDPAVVASQSGYGRELIEHALVYQLKAKTHYEIVPGGVCCSISVPILT